ncbi:MAG: DUF971 domain-containing protein [Myxococcales bacterium]|nr:DUF971 domain-containing protein [Myxococcales bacterium]
MALKNDPPKPLHHPVEVNLREEERLLEVTWSDGRVSTYPLRYLRGFCPCATCQGHRAGEPEFVHTHKESILDVRPVGSYGMNVIWDSGHDTGIYSFAYLRDLDPQQKFPEGIHPDYL